MSETNASFDSLYDFQDNKDCSVLDYAMRQFNQVFETAEDCFEYLYQKIYAGKEVSCTKCGGAMNRERAGTRVVICIDCGKSSSITTGTFFEKTKRIKEWFTAIWLLECGVKINPLRLSQITGLAYSSAWLIFQRVSLVVTANIGNDIQLAPVDIFFSVISRRSCNSEAKKHPAEELDSMQTEKGNNEVTINLSSNDESMTPSEKLILKLVSNGPISFDKICIESGFPAKQVSSSLALLELGSHVRVLPGNKYSSNSISLSSSFEMRGNQILSKSNSSLINFVERLEEFVKAIHKGISLKYLQNYLALSMCFNYRERWSRGNLFHACFRAKSICRSEITAIESPRFVKLAMA